MPTQVCAGADRPLGPPLPGCPIIMPRLMTTPLRSFLSAPPVHSSPHQTVKLAQVSLGLPARRRAEELGETGRASFARGREAAIAGIASESWRIRKPLLDDHAS